MSGIGRLCGRHLAVGVLGAVLVAGAGAPVSAQTHYWRSMTPAYGLGGLGVSAAIGQLSGGSAWLPYGEFLIGAGVVSGIVIGRSVDGRLRTGQHVSGFQRNALRAKTVLYGGAVGALLATAIISPNGQNHVLSEGQVAGVLIGAGMVGGAIVQRRKERKWVDGSPVVIRSSLTPDGRTGIVATYTF